MRILPFGRIPAKVGFAEPQSLMQGDQAAIPRVVGVVRRLQDLITVALINGRLMLA
ncbi:MAG: hypothetical protein ABW002_12670 [Xanthomonas sp.]